MASGINLFIAPLDKKINDIFLKNEFSKFGDLFSAVVAKGENGESKGYGFVNFCSAEDGLKAMKEMTGKMLFGKTLNVQLANTQNEGRCFEGARSTMWTNNWNQDSSPLSRDYEESEYDQRSHISEVTDDQNSPGQWDVKERMKRLFESKSFTDVTFYPKNNRSVSISAHRAVLAISSPLFTKMLFGDQNKNTEGMKMEVQISNLPFDAFSNIVKYLYTDEIFFEDDSLVQGILDGAKQFGIVRLANRCKQYFESLELTDQNVCSKLQLSISKKIDVLKERCIEFIQKNTLQAINSADFQRCTSSTVRAICKLQSLNLRSEKELLDAVIKWLDAQPLQNRKQLKEPLLKHVQFLTLTVAEFGDILNKHQDLLSSGDGLSIMLYLCHPTKSPDFEKLPSWCNKSLTSRCFYTEISCAPNAAGPKRSLLPTTYQPINLYLPLKTNFERIPVIELTSFLRMDCIRGFHEIKAVKLLFEKPQNDKSLIGSLIIRVRVHPTGFNTHETLQIVNSESVRAEFKTGIRVRRGDSVVIEAEAKDIRSYRFLEFNDAYSLTANPHFHYVLSSTPRQSKLFFISEVEYGPQAINSETFKMNSRPRRGRR